MAAPELQQGTLDLLILTTLHAGELHGWAISRRIQQRSGDVLRVGQGSLYPALYRLEERGLLKTSRRSASIRLTGPLTSHIYHPPSIC